MFMEIVRIIGLVMVALNLTFVGFCVLDVAVPKLQRFLREWLKS